MRAGVLLMVYSIYILAGISACFHSCTHNSRYIDKSGSGYPHEIAAIILNKCAISGCHSELSFKNAGGLNLSTWTKLFDGGEAGAVVIPYRPDFSPLCYFTNVDSSLGISLKPTMPYGNIPLSKEEYLRIRDWIKRGAPDVNGSVRFADNSERQKFYVANRLCNVVTVIDASGMLQMRYIDVGGGKVQFPYCVKVAPNKNRWYVSFFMQSDFVQQFDAAQDKFIANIQLGAGAWSSFAISADSRRGWFVDNSSIGKVVYVDLEKNVVLATYLFGGKLKYPKGIVINSEEDKLYIGAEFGNFVYAIDISDTLFPVINEIPIDGSGVVVHEPLLDPGVLLVDDRSHKCYIACGASDEVYIMDMRSDSVTGSISLNGNPADIAIYADKLFIACPDDILTFPGKRGSVVIADIKTNRIVKALYTGYQPYSIAVDQIHGRAAVVNANISSGGPASHHVSGCGEKNGNVTFIDLNTNELVKGKALEVAVFPCDISIR